MHKCDTKSLRMTKLHASVIGRKCIDYYICDKCGSKWNKEYIEPEKITSRPRHNWRKVA